MRCNRYSIGRTALSIALCVCFTGAQAQHHVADRQSAGDARGPQSITDVAGDFIFGGGMEETNGGTSCASANKIHWLTTYVADTTNLPNWILGVGPISVPAHDAIYSFIPGPGAIGSFTPIAADFEFAMFVIPSCSETQLQPAPLAATSTIGESIDMEAAGLVQFQKYYLVITGLPAAGADANGSLTFTSPWVLGIDPDP